MWEDAFQTVEEFWIQSDALSYFYIIFDHCDKTTNGKHSYSKCSINLLKLPTRLKETFPSIHTSELVGCFNGQSEL